MPASRNDMFVLSTDSGFQHRVRSSMIAAAIAIAGEGFSVAFHKARADYASNILNAPDSFFPLFANSCATDASVISDATQSGTVVLTSANVAAQAALVTDAHIDTAVSAEYNAFLKLP